ncbi:MAG: carbon starvation CstA 5TM domain-containing protein [Vicinamibacterales bacterium]
MFEALFILTTIDSGTRVGRFLMQEFLGKAFPKFGQKEWMPGAMTATALLVRAWGYFIDTGEINTIWPMFGVANQLLASVALATATTILINMGKAKYTWVTLLPLAFLATNTLYGGYLNVVDNYYPLAVGPNAATHVQGWILTICTIAMMICALIILAQAISKWVSVLGGGGQLATQTEN